jgi:hypothetical protein
VADRIHEYLRSIEQRTELANLRAAKVCCGHRQSMLLAIGGVFLLAFGTGAVLWLGS